MDNDNCLEGLDNCLTETLDNIPDIPDSDMDVECTGSFENLIREAVFPSADNSHTSTASKNVSSAAPARQFKVVLRRTGDGEEFVNEILRGLEWLNDAGGEFLEKIISDLDFVRGRLLEIRNSKITEQNQERLRLLKDVSKSRLQQQRQDFKAMRLKWERGSNDASALKTELTASLRRLECSEAHAQTMAKSLAVAAEDAKYYKEAKDTMERNYLMQIEENARMKDMFATIETELLSVNSDLSKSVSQQNAALRGWFSKNRHLASHLKSCLDQSRNLEKRVAALSLDAKYYKEAKDTMERNYLMQIEVLCREFFRSFLKGRSNFFVYEGRSLRVFML